MGLSHLLLGCSHFLVLGSLYQVQDPYEESIFDISHSGVQNVSLMIVAHPDDETLFGFGLLMEEGERWIVLSLTGASNKTRAAEFHNACRIAGAIPMMWDYPDSANFGTLGGTIPAAVRLQELIRSTQWHRIASHSEIGEYCHPQHIETHAVVLDLVAAKDFWVFQPLDLVSMHDYVFSFHAAQRRKLFSCYSSQSSILEDFSWVVPGAVPLRNFDRWHAIGLARAYGRCL